MSSGYLKREFERLAAKEAAARLIGCDIIREIDGAKLSGRVIEAEAYDQYDAASHSFRGETKRNSVMFGPAGRAYVYFTYGMHYCLNVVTGPEGYGAAVLVRSLFPLSGQNVMFVNRGASSLPQLLNGPAKITQALAIDLCFNGHDLETSPLKLVLREPVDKNRLIWSKRIGISQAKDELWRVCLKTPYGTRAVH